MSWWNSSGRTLVLSNVHSRFHGSYQVGHSQRRVTG